MILGNKHLTTDDHIINCKPDEFYNTVISCSNSHNKLNKTKIRQSWNHFEFLKITRLDGPQ